MSGAFDFNIDWGLLGNVGNNMVSMANNVGNNMVTTANANAERAMLAPLNAQKMATDAQALNAQKFALAKQQFDMQSQIFGSVALNPSADSYANALTSARKLGLDVSDAPQEWSSQASNYAQQKLLQSGQGLEYLKAQYQMAQIGIDMTAKASQANAGAATAGQPLPFPSGLPGSMAPSGGLLGAMPNMSGTMQGAATGTIPGGMAQPSQIAQTQGVVSSQLTGPAEVKSQETQATNWQAYKKDINAAASSYLTTKQAIATMSSLIDKTPNSGPLTGDRLAAINTDYQALGTQAQALNLGAIATFTKSSGISRLDLPLVRQLQQLTPGVDKFPDVNRLEIGRLNYLNEKTNAANQLMPVLDSQGIRDPNAATQIINSAIEKTGAYNPKNGAVDPVKMHQWSNFLPPQIKQSFDAKNPDEALLSSLDPHTLQKFYTHGYTDQDIIAANNKLNPQSNAAAQTAGQQASIVGTINPTSNTSALPPSGQNVAIVRQGNQQIAVDRNILPISQAIAQQESSNNYNAIGKVTSNGDRALGKYQIMSRNVPAWSKEVLGQAITPAQFMANPRLQDIIAQAKMNQYYQQSGNVEDVISKWFSGRPFKGNNAYDSASQLGVPAYVQQVLGRLKKLVPQYSPVGIGQGSLNG